MRKVFKYRLYPKKSQITALQLQLDCCRWVYNKTIEVRQETWENQGIALSRYDTQNMLPVWKDELPWLKSGYAQSLQETQKRVDLAFRSFFRRIKSGEKPGHPRFKSQKRFDSFTYPQNNRSWSFVSIQVLRLPKIGDVKIKLHREVVGIQKTLTIHRDCTGKWFALFSCIVPDNHLPKTDSVVGVDVGITTFATLSNGAGIDNPRFLKRDQCAIAKAQRQMDKQPNGTKRYLKNKHRVQHICSRVTNRRHNFAHQESRRLVNQHQLLVFEKLQIQEMKHGNYRSMNRSINDVPWDLFMQLCSSKAEEAGRTVVFVDPRGTTQMCSGCGTVVPKDLSVRVHDCPGCGLVLGRDHNAALNILARGLASLGVSPKRPYGSTEVTATTCHRENVMDLDGDYLGSDGLSQ